MGIDYLCSYYSTGLEPIFLHHECIVNTSLTKRGGTLLQHPEASGLVCVPSDVCAMVNTQRVFTQAILSLGDYYTP